MRFALRENNFLILKKSLAGSSAATNVRSFLTIEVQKSPQSLRNRAAAGAIL